MSLAAIVALLQAALMLLTIVSSHPELPQSVRENASMVAQQAITQATAALAANPPAVPPSSVKFFASPASGSAPFTVKFTGTTNGAYSLDFGDGTPNVGVACGGAPCGTTTVDQAHTYAKVGAYVAILHDSNGTQTVTITVRSSNASCPQVKYNIKWLQGSHPQNNYDANGCMVQPSCVP
jgi:PKD repeat protein